jgi:DNA-binding response OmpR family regulator
MNNPIVLVVDDEKSLRDFVRKNLEVRGYKVLTASNGLEAMAVFNTERVDLVILDIMMPHLDGLETTRQDPPELDRAYYRPDRPGRRN